MHYWIYPFRQVFSGPQKHDLHLYAQIYPHNTALREGSQLVPVLQAEGTEAQGDWTICPKSHWKILAEAERSRRSAVLFSSLTQEPYNS